MNDPGDLTVTHSSSATPDPKNCNLVSILPIVGMSSCRGRAEAFARRLSSKLRTLGSQADGADVSQEDEPITNGGNINTWLSGGVGGSVEQTVTDLQPLRRETDSFFDFDCEIESPGSPADECEYLRLIESASNTPHTSAAESGYACASIASSHSSSEGTYYDVNSDYEACTSHLLKPAQQQNQQNTSNHMCQLCSEVPTANDEVDSVSISISRDQNRGFRKHNDSSEALPSEGPDIKLMKHTNNDFKVENPKQISMTNSVQELILKELHQQSLDYKDEEHENNEINSPNEEIKTETKVENDIVEEMAQDMAKMEINQESIQLVHLINCHTENGEDVLEIEMEEVPKEEMKAEEIKINTEEHMSKDNEQRSYENVNCKTDNEKPKSSHLHMEATDDEEDCRPQAIRRCSSLKTGKTPPGTPGNKKIVRFADVLGLDLADVKTFLDEIPNIPKSAFEDLEISEAEPQIQLGPKTNKLLMPLFQQPGGLPIFLDMVREKLVCLENAAITDIVNQTITGCVRVRNLDFQKSVHIRYSLDGWRSFADLQANYVKNSCDGFSDKFTFVLFGNSLHVGQRLEFAVRFQCKGHQYWDNNFGSNYCFQCLPSVTPSTISPITTVLPPHHSNNMIALLNPSVAETWCTSFY